MKARFFRATVLIAALALVWSWIQLPERVAIHFDFSGAPDNWASRSGAVLIMGAICLGMFLLFWALARWLPRLPLSLLNLPPATKARWVEAGQERQLKASMGEDLYVIGGLTMLLLSGVQVLTVLANRREPAALGWGAIVLVGLFLAAITTWTVGMLRRYREPPA
ncbi:MAG: DUF1648 domain-containing protein [Burkholderiaceae bacterium]|nr:DUF1648 domain-containing protein [Burkholderiaceae bacterium]